jgi:hypothetical protein
LRIFPIKGPLHRLASGPEEKRRIKVSTMSDISTQFSRLDRYLFTDTLKKHTGKLNCLMRNKISTTNVSELGYLFHD